MSSDGLLSLKWNNHHSSFMQALSTLRNKGSYSDITLACAGKFYSVHKLILSTCSDYFVEIMNKTPCKHPIIVLKDIRHQDLEALLNYMYLGEVNVLQNELASLIKAAECLRIKGLAVPDETTPIDGDVDKTEERYEKGRKDNKRRYEDGDLTEIDSSPASKKINNHGMVENSEVGNIQKEKVNVEDNSSGYRLQQKNDTTFAGGCRESIQEPALLENTVIKQESVVKYEDEDDLPVADTEKQIDDSGLVSQGPDPLDQIVYQNSVASDALGESNSLQSHPPQTFEEIVSQALPGSSLQTDGGQSWDSMQGKRDVPPFVSPHRQTLQSMGQARSGWGHQDTCGPPLQPANIPRETDDHHSYHRTFAEINPSLPHDDPSRHQTNSQFIDSLDKRCCQVCGYKGQDVAQLRKHLRIHTGEKPYKCPKCDYCSAQSSNLRVHMKRHHFDQVCQEMSAEMQYQKGDTILLD